MKILYIFLKYIYILGLTAASVNILIASAKHITREVKSGIIFFSTALFFSFLFLSVLIYQSKWQFFCKDERMNQSIRLFDRREWLKDERVEMGNILDRTGGKNLALSIMINNQRKRIYPLGKEASHLVGYWDIEKGGAGIERCYHDFLVGKEFNFLNYFSMKKQKGKELHLTIDSKLQYEAYSSFGERCGAAVALIPKTGEVLCLVSSPGFPTNEISDEQTWISIINNSEEAPMFNRALKGRYPPGSVFKIVTAAAAIENNFNKRFYCAPEGYLPSGTKRRIFDIEKRIYEKKGKIWKGHGYLDLESAMEKSSNVYFSKLGVTLGREIIKKYAEKFGFNQKLKWNSNNDLFKKDFSINTGFFSEYEDISESDLAWASIGQQKVLVTPIQVVLLTAAIANDGIFVYPKIEKNQKDKKGWRVIKKSTAKRLQDILRNVVKNGTGFRVNISGLEVAGKTGTAEKAGMRNISWFTAFAPYSNARIAIAVVVENGGYGGEDAALIAKNILIEAKNLGYFD